MALEDLREGSGRASTRRGFPGTGRAVCFVLLAGVVSVWQPWRGSGRSATALRAVTVTTLPGAERQPSLLRTATNVVFSWAGAQTGQQGHLRADDRTGLARSG